MKRAVVILEVMWDWRNMTGRAGYRDRAPRYFSINPDNHSGKRLHAWLKGYQFVVTNACPQLVSAATGRGTPDKAWLSENLGQLRPFELLVVCGKVAQATYERMDAGTARVIEMPHPAARYWNRAGMDLMRETIRSGSLSGRINYDRHAKTFSFLPLS